MTMDEWWRDVVVDNPWFAHIGKVAGVVVGACIMVAGISAYLGEPETPADRQAKMIQGAIYRTCGSHKGRMFSNGMIACDGYD